MPVRVLLGDEAVALGAVHAGITAAYAYPGTPSTEILEFILQHEREAAMERAAPHAAWCANEKTAYEAALGASIAGGRSSQKERIGESENARKIIAANALGKEALDLAEVRLARLREREKGKRKLEEEANSLDKQVITLGERCGAEERDIERVRTELLRDERSLAERKKGLSADAATQALSSRLPELRAAIDPARFAALAAQLGLLLGVFWALRVESSRFFILSACAFVGFAVHYFVPFRWKKHAFIGISLAGGYIVLSQSTGAPWPLSIALPLSAVGLVVALGAAFGGHLGVTTTSGPGLDLKSETIGLAVALELPLIVVDIQRGGPSTGLPTKTEQSDLLHAMFGRHGESPVPVIAAWSPPSCFWAAIEAARIAVKYMTPVILLTDASLANGAEPWRIPSVAKFPDISVPFASRPNVGDSFWPYLRDDETLGRPWAIPGTPGLEHRIGGLEKADGTGNISYDPENHDHMVRMRAEKVRRVAQEIPPTSINGPATGDLLVVGWGGTYGAITAAVERAQADGKSVAQIHLRHLNPLPPDLGHVLREYRKVLVPEINSGQLVRVLRAEYLVDAVGFNRVRGLPLSSEEIYDAVCQLSGGEG